MAVSFDIRSDIHVVLVRYDGYADLASTIAAAEACTSHPDFHPGLPHYFDFSRTTGYEKDFPTFFQLQARLVEKYLPQETELLVVFHAPDGPAREMAELARRSWDGVPNMVIRIAKTERDALDILGLEPADLAAGSKV